MYLLVKFKQIFFGLLTKIPLLGKVIVKYYFSTTGGSNSAKYCYSVWLRHIVKVYKVTGKSEFNTICELGPGESIGIGLCGLLFGSEKYIGLDIIEFNKPEKSLIIFNEMVEMLRLKLPIPFTNEHSKIKPTISIYDFPSYIYNDDLISKLLQEDRLQNIRNSILEVNSPNSLIKYIAPWETSNFTIPSYDLLISQSVLEYFEDVSIILSKITRFSKLNSIQSHQIDYKSLKSSSLWNGHWKYTNETWKIIKGGRPCIVNRWYHSMYVKLFSEGGLRILDMELFKSENTLKIEELSEFHSQIQPIDMSISGGYFIVEKIGN
jgi:hypothetical protein